MCPPAPKGAWVPLQGGGEPPALQGMTHPSAFHCLQTAIASERCALHFLSPNSTSLEGREGAKPCQNTLPFQQPIPADNRQLTSERVMVPAGCRVADSSCLTRLSTAEVFGAPSEGWHMRLKPPEGVLGVWGVPSQEVEESPGLHWLWGAAPARNDGE